MRRRSLLLTLLVIAASPPISSSKADPTGAVVSRSEIEFVPLNPARGDASPKAGALWGDLRKDVPTGAIIEFSAGFSSPPHIHNVTYRGVVIRGAVHNDDPDAENLWMGPGSFWTQPAGESHITSAAQASPAVAFLETSEGPYLVRPSSEAFDNGERPVNLEARNVVWLGSSDLAWLEPPETSGSVEGAKVAFLWGAPQEGGMSGSFVKMPSSFRGTLRSTGAWLRAVVIQGQVDHRRSGESDMRRLGPGSYFGAKGGAAHEVTCAAQADCLLYVSAEGRYLLGQS